MRYVEKARFSSAWGKRVSSTEGTIAAIAQRESIEPTVVVTIETLEVAFDAELSPTLAAQSSAYLSPEAARRFGERLLRSADEAEERARRLRYAAEVKEVLS